MNSGKRYTEEFKIEAVKQVTERRQGYRHTGLHIFFGAVLPGLSFTRVFMRVRGCQCF